jgi:uncharacterized repeat protein (TIGR03803 family)
MSLAKFIHAALLLLVGLAAVPSVWAQTYKVLYTFEGGTDGAYPFAGLVRDSAGNLYGTTVGADQGGLPGSVFKVSPSVGFTLLHSFKYGGASRPGTLVRDSAGNLYGATIAWGTSPSTIFKLTKTGRFSVLHTFTAGSGSGGSGEGGTLTLDSVGNLYGTGGDNSACGGHGCGFIFKLDPSGHETVLHYFPGGKRGTGPNGGLIRDAAGNLYGTTGAGGGPGNHGVVFKLDPAGNETVLYAFKGEPDGSQPNGGLIQDAAGNFYGTTEWGGKGNCQGMSCGVVFKLDTNGTETVLYSFSGVPDGGNPLAGLVMD